VSRDTPRVTFYEFIDKAPAIGRLVVVEGTEHFLAHRAIATIVERKLAPAERELNLDRFVATELSSFAPVEAAVAALPFLGSTRVVVVENAHELRLEPRRALLAVAETVPTGNTLILEDLVSPQSKRPESLGKLLGRAALRIDTTATDEARQRFIRESLASLRATAEPAAIAALVASDADLTGIATDLEKLALGGTTIGLDDVMREALVSSDVRAYRYAAAAVAGRVPEALALAEELFATDPRSAAIPLLAALAAEYSFVWEAARPGGQLPARARWRERELQPIARRLGERRAKLGFERAVRGFEAIVTGRADDPRLVVELATAAAAYPQGR
jgi:DNA polymerase III delta subunit